MDIFRGNLRIALKIAKTFGLPKADFSTFAIGQKKTLIVMGLKMKFYYQYGG